MNRRHTLLLFIFGAALLVRILAVLVMDEVPEEGDAGKYDEIAVNLAEGRGFSFRGEPTARFLACRGGFCLP